MFILVLLFMVYLAGARNFTNGFVNSYIIWSAVNWFDVFVLDIGIDLPLCKKHLQSTACYDTLCTLQ